MKLGRIVVGLIGSLMLSVIIGGSAEAHTIFKKEMDKKYPTMKVTCNACHVDKQPKTERNSFGKLFYKEFEKEELTKNWKAKKGADKKDYEAKVMIPAFEKALAKVSAMTYDDIIKAGMVDGIDDPAKKEDEE